MSIEKNSSRSLRRFFWFLASGAALTALACSSAPPTGELDTPNEDLAPAQASAIDRTPRSASEVAHLVSPIVRQSALDRRLSMRVANDLDAAGMARVIVTLDVPEAARFTARLYDHPDHLTAQRAIARVTDDVLASAGALEVNRRFHTVNAIALTIAPEHVAKLLAHPSVASVALDEGGAAHGKVDLALAKLDAVQGQQGLDGKGVTVAIVDTGIELDHPDFAGRITGEACFCTLSSGAGCCPSGATTQIGSGAARDDLNGHGTNVAGIVAGGGAKADKGGAPAASIVAVKVLDASGSFYSASDVIAGLDWIIANRRDVKVVNASLGTSALYANDCDDNRNPGERENIAPWKTVVDTLRANGVLLVASSGNNGSTSAMGLPACLRNTLSVGAVWNQAHDFPVQTFCTDTSTVPDQIACFTNSDAALDLLAPGAYVDSSGLHAGISEYYGTSQAAPFVASCATLLLQKYPGTSPARLIEALAASPTRVRDARNALTFPRLDCADALARLAPPVCTPRCNGATCGTDGCGGTCACAAGATCNAAKQCVAACVPHCAPNTCGTDGCGGTCACAAGTTCNAAKQCVAACVPLCAPNTCGTDGCGGTCACAAGTTCNSAKQCVAPTGGGNCAGVAGWSSTKNWTTYGPNERNTFRSDPTKATRLYQCKAKEWCYLQPDQDTTHLGWIDLGVCN